MAFAFDERSIRLLSPSIRDEALRAYRAGDMAGVARLISERAGAEVRVQEPAAVVMAAQTPAQAPPPVALTVAPLPVVAQPGRTFGEPRRPWALYGVGVALAIGVIFAAPLDVALIHPQSAPQACVLEGICGAPVARQQATVNPPTAVQTRTLETVSRTVATVAPTTPTIAPTAPPVAAQPNPLAVATPAPRAMPQATTPVAAPAQPVQVGPQGNPSATLYVAPAPTQPAVYMHCTIIDGQPCWDAVNADWWCFDAVTGGVHPCGAAELQTMQRGLPLAAKVIDCMGGVGCKFGKG